MNYFFEILILSLAAVYFLIILRYTQWFIALKKFIAGHVPAQQTFFSVVIPARNEEENITACILSVLKNNYPPHLFEIIIADDFSTDNTAAIVQQLQKEHANIRLIQMKDEISAQLNSYKKKAIEIAIGASAGEWIVTTDADCIVPENWLMLFDNIIQQKSCVFVAAPVSYINTGSFLSVFQCLDFLTLQGITAASVSANYHSMCNGANIAYSKKVFYEVNGFKGVDNIASGDDMLLMHKIKERYPSGLAYLFSSAAIVTTKPVEGIRNFFNQRIRWASKATHYNDKQIFAVLLIVYLFNLCLFILFVTSLFVPAWWYYTIMLLLSKTICELLFLFPVTSFYKQKKLLWLFPVMQPFHILYTIIAGFLGKFGTYQWKGRTVK